MHLLIQGCIRNDRDSQRLLYQHYYPYALSICFRYSRSMAEAKEVVNDGFMKVFTRIKQYQPEASFQGWLRRIMINASIDHYRKELKFQYHKPIDKVQFAWQQPEALSALTHEEILMLVQRLSPAYRAVFNLYVIDGFNHEEIAKMLGISSGTSKSNLLKARENLKKMLEESNRMPYGKVN